MTAGRAACADRPELGNRDLEVREHLEQEGLELLVRAVDLVDEEHDRLVGVDRLEQRAPDEELGTEELLLGHRALLRGADVQELARVVPLVDGVRDVEALVALEPNQARVESSRERLRGLGLADAGLTFEEHRLLEREPEEQRRREAAIGEVVRPAERDVELVDRAEPHRRSVDEAGRQGVRRRRVAAPRTSASTIAPITTTTSSTSRAVELVARSRVRARRRHTSCGSTYEIQ